PVAGELLGVAAAHGDDPRVPQTPGRQVVDHAHKTYAYDPNPHHFRMSFLNRFAGKGNSSRPAHYHEPRLRTTFAEAELLEVGPDLDPCGLKGLDAPALTEGGVQSPLRPPPRPLLARLLVAETEQGQPTARFQDRRQPFDVAAAVIVA